MYFYVRLSYCIEINAASALTIACAIILDPASFGIEEFGKMHTMSSRWLGHSHAQMAESAKDLDWFCMPRCKCSTVVGKD